MARTKKQIPAFASDREEAAFWAEHSLEEFADALDDLDVQIRPARTEQIAIRLYPDDLAILRALAAQQGVGPTTLTRTVLERWVEGCRKKRSTSSTKRHPPRLAK